MVLLMLALTFAGCGTTEQAVPLVETESEEALDCPIPSSLVPASEVEVLGDLEPEDEAIVSWALGRFAIIDLELSTPIRVYFDASRKLCKGEPGRCLLFTDAAAKLFVCEAAGATSARIADRRLTVLHELAHVWHFGKGDGLDWPDLSEVVGGQQAGPEVHWNDRTVERVADVISWGLMDFERRKARGDIPCDEMYAYFVELTGHRPLPPVNPSCEPAGGEDAAAE